MLITGSSFQEPHPLNMLFSPPPSPFLAVPVPAPDPFSALLPLFAKPFSPEDRLPPSLTPN